MEIYLTDGSEEYGPYSRDDLFTLLRAGELDAATLARSGEETEWRPVMEVLKKTAASALFSVEEIAARECASELPKLVFEAARPRSESPRTETTRRQSMRTTLLLGGVIAVIAFVSTFYWFRRSESEGRPQATVAVSSVVSTVSTPSASLLAITPLPAQLPVASAAPQAGPSVVAVEAPPMPLANQSPSMPLANQPPSMPKASPALAGPVARPRGVRRDDHPTVHQTDLFKTTKVSPEELMEILTERFASTPVQILDSYDERVDKLLKSYEGSFYLDTNLKWNPKVEVVYKIPLRNEKFAGPHASNIVMLGFYPGAAAPPEVKVIDGKEVREKSKLYGSLSYYSDKLGYTAFSMHMVTKKGEGDDLDESYFQAGPEWVDIVFRAKEELERRYKLKSRKLLLCGMSLGGTFVERIAAARPDQVAAVAAHSAPEITLPKAPSDTAWFLGISRGDSMLANYSHLFNGLQDLDDNINFGVFPPNYGKRGETGNFYHTESPIASTAARSFLKGVVEASPTGKIDVTKWPYLRDRSKPLRIFHAGTPEANRIPPENREYFPSRAFVQCLQAIPAPMQTVSLGKLGGRELKCLVGLPPLGKPKGVLVYSEKLIYANISTMMDNIYYLANQGYLVLAPNLAGLDTSAIKTTVRYVRQAPLLKQLPLVYVGSGEKANCVWDFVAKDPDAAAKAVAVVGFEPGKAFEEARATVGSGIKCPILFIYDEKPLVNVSTAEEARQSLAKVRAVDDFVKTCKERHQPARVIYIPKDTGTEVRVAQKSMESVDAILSQVIEGHNSAMEER